MDETRGDIGLRKPLPTPRSLISLARGLITGLWLGLLLSLAAQGQIQGEQTDPDSISLGAAIQFEHLLPQDGLSDITAYSLLQDRTGFLWVGTEGGLNRFDGYQFEIFRHDPNAMTSLASDDVSFMLQDSTGLIWLATWGGGLERFDPVTGRFDHFRKDSGRGAPARPDRLQDNRIQHLFEDSKGVLWIGTFAGGLSRFAPSVDATTDEDPATSTFLTYRHDPEDPSSLCHDRIWRILEDASGTFWIATQKGLCLFDRASGTFERFTHRPGDPTSLSDDIVRTLYADSSGVLWVGTSRGLNRFDRLSKTFQQVTIDPESASPPAINAVFEDSMGTLWVGTLGHGLNAFDRGSKTWRQYRNDPQQPSSLSDNDVRAILEDRSGILWIATRQGGLNKLDLKVAKFETVTRQQSSGQTESDGLSNERIRALAEDAQGRLWIGTAGGLDHYDPALATFTHFKHDARNPASLPSNDVHRLMIDSSETLWIGAGPGLYRFDTATSSFVTLNLDTGENPSTDTEEQVNDLLEDRAGNLWVGRVSGLDCLDRERRIVQRFHHSSTDPESLSESFVTVLFEDTSGTLWIGTHNGGINRFDISRAPLPRDVASGFQRFINDPRDSDSLSNNRVSVIHQQASGSLWIGTANGLNEMRADGTFRRLLEKDGLPHPQIAGIQGDDTGGLWIATGRGLSRLDPETGVFRSYTARDGLQGDRFNVGAALKRRDGRLCFGGNKGYSCFNPRRVVDNLHAPPVVLTGFMKLGESVDLGRAAWAVDNIQLAHDDNFFSFEFAALDYTRPEDNGYRFQLENFDRNWTEAGSRRSANYTNVPPGDYVFRVQGSNNDEVWNREGLSIAVSIKPPFWQTTWFRILATMLTITAVGGAYHARVRSLKRREHKLARRVEESLADLKRSEERYRTLFERNLAGVVRATIDGSILDCNDAFARLLGYSSPEECRERHVIDFDNVLDEKPSVAERLSQDGTIISYESSARTRDGSMIALLWNATLVLAPGDGPPVVEGTAIDVSERRRIEEGLRRAQKLESLGVLAGGIAHDFNNLLLSIMGNAELARRELEPTSPVISRLDRIDTASGRAAELARQMLAYSGKGDFVVTRLDLSDAVREMADLLAGAVSKKARLVYELESNLPAVEADGGQIEQIVMSLVTNASEALGSADGAITVRTGSREYSPADLAGTYLDDRLPAGCYVFLEIDDDGCGMDEELQPKIFDPFFTTKFTGRGLGLAAVLGIVRGHRGAIRIDSAQGRGSTFTVSFPAATEATTPKHAPTKTTSPKPAPPAEAPRRRPEKSTILVVDDDESVRRVAQDMLSGLGFDVLTAGDGQEGVEIFRRRADEIELVVLDLSMPRMSGAEAFSEIRKAVPTARVLLASGYDEHESIRRFTGQGLSGFIQKPYRLADLKEKVQQVLAEPQPPGGPAR